MATPESQGTPPAREPFEPGPLLLMGAPGVGKGTQAKELAGRWAIPQISTGDLLRAHVASGSPLGTEARQLMEQGTLVPDALVNRMVEQRLGDPDTVPGYMLDGYPRTLAQAQWLDRKLAAGPRALPLIALSIRVAYTQLLRRVTGRRICPRCGSIYNTYLHPPKQEGVCDLDGTSLVRRDDDSEAVFEDRLRAYEAQTAPVVEHYRSLGRLTEMDGEGTPESITARLAEAVERLRRKP